MLVVRLKWLSFSVFHTVALLVSMTLILVIILEIFRIFMMMQMLMFFCLTMKSAPYSDNFSVDISLLLLSP